MEINIIIKQLTKVSLRATSDAPNANCEERKAKIEMQNGFTLLELLLVIAIIAVLAGIIMFALNPADRIQEANETKYMSNAKDIEKALNSYVVDNGGNLPSTFNSLSYGYYDICKQGQSGSCVSIDELVTSGKMSTIPVDSNNQTGSTTGFKVRYDPLKREGVIYSNAMYVERIESGTTLTEGLVGWWKMDEASWNVSDSSGNNNIASAINTISASGKYGNSRNTSTNGYFSIIDNQKLDFGMTDFSASVWIYVDSVQIASNQEYSIFNKNNNYQNSPGWGVEVSSWSKVAPFPSLNVSFFNSGQNVWCNTCASRTDGIQTNVWNHILVTRRGGSNELYINGQLMASNVHTQVGLNVDNGSNLIIGDHGWGPNFPGKIDEARIYNRALNADEIAGLYNYAPFPIAYWKFDEGSGTTTRDSSGNNLNGTLINSPTWVTGKYGNALSFDGIDDYINFGDNQLHRLTFGGTVSLWVSPYAYPPGINRWGKLIDKGNWGAGRNDYSIYFQGSNNTLKFEVDGSTASQSVSVANTEVPLNQWKYLSLTWDGSYIKSYIDGVQVSQTVQSISPDTAGYSLQISSNNSNFAFSGLIDEVRIYNYARTQEQIVEDMNNF